MRFFYSLALLLLPFVTLSQWTTQASGFADTLRGLQHIWVVNENIAWATAYDNSGNDMPVQEFTRTLDGGATWVPGNVTGVPGHMPSMIFALNADIAWVMYHDPDNDGGKILRTNNGGLTWTHQSSALFADSLGAYPNLIYFWNANEGFAMGDPTSGYFELYTTTNGGALWTRVPMANIPPIISGEYGYEGRFSVIGSTIFFGTNKGRLLKSVDKGYNWTAINTPLLSTGRARVVEFRDSLNGLIADRANDVYVLYETSNGGASWQAITTTGPVYGNDLRYMPGSLATYVSTGDKSGVSGASVSYDAGHTWTDITSPPGAKYGALACSNQMTAWAGQISHGPSQGGVAKLKLLSRDAQALIYPNSVPQCSGNRDFYGVVYNTGFGILESVEVHLKLNGIPKASVNANVSLLPNQVANIYLGNHSIAAGTSTQVCVYTALPNGLTDTINSNDTAFSTPFIDQSPQVNLGSDTSIHAGNSYILDAGPGFTSYQWSTGQTGQIITVDSSGVGIGTKSISVLVIGANNCDASDTMSLNFHYVAGFENLTTGNERFLLYPVPVNGTLYIETEGYGTLQGIYIYDGGGRKVIECAMQNIDSGIDVSMLTPGIYIVQALFPDTVLRRKIIITQP